MIAYLLKVTICWSLFYVIYHFLLSKETFFKINRWYLLSTLIIGLILPLFEIDFTAFFEQEPAAAIAYASESFHQMEAVIEVSVLEAGGAPFSWFNLLLVIYWIGVIVTFLRFLYGFNQIFQLYRTGTVTKKENYFLVLTTTPHLPFSFFNYIFWYESINLEDIDSGKIISHETAHINQGHSADVLFLEFLGILLWFSPPIYWYKKSLRAVHEFLADAYVLRDTKKKQYGHLLIKQAQSGMQVALANNFIHSQLKKRINMMTRNKSRRKALMRYLPALPILLVAVLLFASKKSNPSLEAYFQNFSAFEQMLTGDFDPQKAKDALKEAYANGSKGWVTEDGKPMDWDAHKITALERTGEKLIETYPDNKGDIFLIMMEVAAENGYALRLKGSKIESYREIENPIHGEEIKMVPSIEQPEKRTVQEQATDSESNYNYVLAPTSDGKIENLRFKNIEFFSYNTLDVYNKWGEIVFSSVNYINDWNGTDLNTGKSLEEGTYYYQLKSNANKKKFQQGYIKLTRNQAPVFSDGEKEMLHFIYKEIRYPAQARAKVTYGTAIVEFTVNKNGEIINPEITQNLADGLGEEVLRVVKLMQALPKKWKPGKKDGEIVDMKFYLPVQFRLEGQYENGDSFTLVDKNGIDHKVVVSGLSKIVRPNKPSLVKTEKPVFPEGEKAMIQFIYRAIKYPAQARDNGTYGTAIVEFTVKKDGSIVHPQIIRDVADGVGQEVLRVVKLMQALPQKWTPGKKDGEVVDMKFTLPVQYRLEGLDNTILEETDERNFKLVVTGLYTKNDKPFKEKIDKRTGSQSAKAKTQTASGEPIYKKVDEMPRFPGCEETEGTAEELKTCGDRKMLEFIYTNIKYPKEAKDKGIQGTVVIRFLVEKDGSIANAEIVRNVGGGTGEEALKVVNMMKEMPQKWIPGRKAGKAVNVYFNLPIKFKLADEGVTKKTEESNDESENRLETIAPHLNSGNPADAVELTLSGKKVVLNAFPNPAKEKLTVTLEGQAKDILLTVFDVTGKELYQNKIKTFDGIIYENIDLTKAAKGALIINVNHKGQNLQKKVIVH